jgi:hypothetical protein
VLHLLTQSPTTNINQQLGSVVTARSLRQFILLILSTQQQINQPMAGFCFQYSLLRKKCILCYDPVVLSPEMCAPN